MSGYTACVANWRVSNVSTFLAYLSLGHHFITVINVFSSRTPLTRSIDLMIGSQKPWWINSLKSQEVSQFLSVFFFSLFLYSYHNLLQRPIILTTIQSADISNQQCEGHYWELYAKLRACETWSLFSPMLAYRRMKAYTRVGGISTGKQWKKASWMTCLKVDSR